VTLIWKEFWLSFRAYCVPTFLKSTFFILSFVSSRQFFGSRIFIHPGSKDQKSTGYRSATLLAGSYPGAGSHILMEKTGSPFNSFKSSMVYVSEEESRARELAKNRQKLKLGKMESRRSSGLPATTSTMMRWLPSRSPRPIRRRSERGFSRYGTLMGLLFLS
jgi:hypothetical protein